MSNPAQWPSFDNWSVQYAEHASYRIRLLTRPAAVIQRWWRQRHLSEFELKLCPSPYPNPFRPDPMLTQHVLAYEKLDGTNFGIRCDGSLFGRRFEVQGTSYQKVPLEGILPDGKTVSCLKDAVIQENEFGRDYFRRTGKNLPTFIVYGELMCQPDRNQYTERGMANIFIAFGGTLDMHGFRKEVKMNLIKSFIRAGFWASSPGGAEKITIKLNPKLETLYRKFGIQCAPLLAQGPVRDVCFSLEEKMMKNDIEGVVLTGESILAKWKTDKEPGSAGNTMLKSILKERHPPLVLRLAGIDEELIECLLRVSPGCPDVDGVPKSNRPKEKAKKRTVQSEEFDVSFDSALTKYDEMESYFERGEIKLFIDLIIGEMKADHGFTDPNDNKRLEKYVKVRVGKAFGNWKMAKYAGRRGDQTL